MNTNESATNAIPEDNFEIADLNRDVRPIEWVPAGTTVAQSVDNLTHVVAKLLQTHMLIQKSLEDISKVLERVAR